MSEWIDHEAEAQDWIAEAPTELANAGLNVGTAERALLCAQLAQAHATLALMEQQRIANLIALAAGGHGGSTGFEHEAMDALGVLGTPHHLQLRPDIAAALGIGDDDE